MNDIHDRPMSKMTRRKFLGTASCAALGTTGLLSTLLNLKMTSKAVAASLDATATSTPTTDDDFKALVCIFQAGGNDSYNMLIPTNTADYAQYKTVRGNLALPTTGTGAVLPLTTLNTPGRTFAVHPAMSEVRDLFNLGKLAFISNVGTLIEPTSLTQYKSESVRIPRALFSHSDQIMQWQTSLPQGGSPTGWAGRLSDVLNAKVNTGSIGMNISLNGNNIMQTGLATTSYAISPKGSIALIGKTVNTGRNALRFDQLNSMADLQYQNLFEQAYMSEYRHSIDNDVIFSTAFAGATVNTVFSDSGLAADLQAVAKTIAARAKLGMKRQVFFVLYGGWDMHQELLQSQNEMLAVLSQSLKNFWDALVELKVQDKVTAFTSSDFGRTLRSNGRGTDHAWGGNHIIMGGSVLGQRIHGQYPDDLGLGGKWDVGTNGRLLPTTSVDQYMAEMALWLGVTKLDLATVFPNIANFYDVGSGKMPVGFLPVPVG